MNYYKFMKLYCIQFTKYICIDYSTTSSSSTVNKYHSPGQEMRLTIFSQLLVHIRSSLSMASHAAVISRTREV